MLSACASAGTVRVSGLLHWTAWSEGQGAGGSPALQHATWYMLVGRFAVLCSGPCLAGVHVLVPACLECLWRLLFVHILYWCCTLSKEPASV